jgi:hypothetical protein
MVGDTDALFRGTLGVNLFDANAFTYPAPVMPAHKTMLEKWSRGDSRKFHCQRP